MNSYIQLVCMIGSLLFGACLYYMNKVNTRLISNKNILIKILISILYLFNVSLLYVVLLYRINDGILHIYFVLFIIIGYIFMCVKKRK